MFDFLTGTAAVPQPITGPPASVQPNMGMAMGYQPQHPQQMAYFQGYQQMQMPAPFFPQPTASVQFGFGGGVTVGIQSPNLYPAMPQPLQPVQYGTQQMPVQQPLQPVQYGTQQMPVQQPLQPIPVQYGAQQMPAQQPNAMVPMLEDDSGCSDDSSEEETSETETAESEDEGGQYVFFTCRYLFIHSRNILFDKHLCLYTTEILPLLKPCLHVALFAYLCDRFDIF